LDAEERGQEAANRAYAARAATRRQEFWDWYSAYLQSDAWRAKRAQALKRDKGLCQGCLERPATQVHHLTYAHVGGELLFELASICDDCHERAHEERR
jgi:5-methylcytosine-specific restriction endonuclease McrA